MDLTNASPIGAGGFGSATVRRLAQMGAKVVIADVSDERGEARPRARAAAGPRRGSTPLAKFAQSSTCISTPPSP
jgi:NAD(P)-dependent dehydrogenase (short-subunit alcohol dehydrogenase family)